MRDNLKERDILLYGGMGIILLGVLLKTIEHEASFWIYAIGLVAIIVARVRQYLNTKGENSRVFIPYLFSTVAFILAGYVMYTNKNYWIVFILLASVLDLYFSFRHK